jgi:hypothetical protein
MEEFKRASMKNKRSNTSKASAAVNPWIAHVKTYAKANGISYGCAITEARASYKREKV